MHDAPLFASSPLVTVAPIKVTTTHCTHQKYLRIIPESFLLPLRTPFRLACPVNAPGIFLVHFLRPYGYIHTPTPMPNLHYATVMLQSSKERRWVQRISPSCFPSKTVNTVYPLSASQNPKGTTSLSRETSPHHFACEFVMPSLPISCSLESH